MPADPFQPWLVRWDLTPDGAAFETAIGSRLMPVLRQGMPAMLKIAAGEEERQGAALMAWYAGQSAARVLQHDDWVILLERAMGPRSLAEMARTGRDDEATVILCRTAAELHAPRAAPPPASLVPLTRWFRQLAPAAAAHGGTFIKSAAAARELLSDPREAVVLHGDYHHENVLDAGARGWLVIDPKGLIGERGFDFANIFNNPTATVAQVDGRLRRQVGIVADLAGLEPVRLLKWILAYSGLSAAWSLDSGHDAHAKDALAVAEIAANELEVR